MYKLEITTADDRESLLYTEEIQTWMAACKKIDFFNSLKLDNVFIKLYKTKDNDLELDYLGNFTDLKPCKRSIKKRSIKASNGIIILELICFPVFLLLDLVNE